MRVLAFAGREHHTSRLASVVAVLRERGHAVEWVIADNAWNIDPAAEFLVSSGEPFVHLLDFVEDVLEINATTAGMLHDIFRRPDGIYNTVGPQVVAYTIREAAEVVAGFSKMLDALQPDRVLLLHENNFWTKPLAYLCHERGIGAASFQEGLIRHRDQETQGKQSTAAEYSRWLFVWSEAARRAYVEAGVEESKVRVVGISYLDQWFRALSETPNAIRSVRSNFRALMGWPVECRIVLFGFPAISRFDGNFEAALGEVVNWCNRANIYGLLRFHPFEGRELLSYMKRTLAGPFVAVSNEASSVPAILAADLVVTQHTSVAVEALALGRPVAELDLEGAGVLESLAEQGVAHHLLGKESLSKIPDILAGTIPLDEARLATWLDENVGLRDGVTAQRVVDILESV